MSADTIQTLIQQLDAKAQEYADTDSQIRVLCDNASDQLESLQSAILRACEIIERADARNLAVDGPAGGSPPQMSLAEWHDLYTVLSESVNPSIEPDEADYPGKFQGVR